MMDTLSIGNGPGVIIMFILTLTSGVIAYLAKRNEASRDRSIEKLKFRCHDIEIANNLQEVTIAKLASKLWSDDKLTNTVREAVRSEMLDWQNRLWEKGIIQKPKKE